MAPCYFTAIKRSSLKKGKERERQTDRHRERQTNREKDRLADRHTEKEGEKEIQTDTVSVSIRSISWCTGCTSDILANCYTWGAQAGQDVVTVGNWSSYIDRVPSFHY